MNEPLWLIWMRARESAMRQREFLCRVLVGLTGCADPRDLVQVEQHFPDGRIEWRLKHRPRSVVAQDERRIW